VFGTRGVTRGVTRGEFRGVTRDVKRVVTAFTVLEIIKNFTYFDLK
jgi:hypothetical protein